MDLIPVSYTHLWCYKDGVLVTETPVTTGNHATGYDTPACRDVYKRQELQLSFLLRQTSKRHKMCIRDSCRSVIARRIIARCDRCFRHQNAILVAPHFLLGNAHLDVCISDIIRRTVICRIKVNRICLLYTSFPLYPLH